MSVETLQSDELIIFEIFEYRRHIAQILAAERLLLRIFNSFQFSHILTEWIFARFCVQKKTTQVH